MNLKPLKFKLYVKEDEKKLVTESGLQMVNYNLEGGLRRGTVVAVGDKVRDISVGARVAYFVFEGRYVNHEGERLHILYDHEIELKLESE